jgi:hypothetical protein
MICEKKKKFYVKEKTLSPMKKKKKSHEHEVKQEPILYPLEIK